MKYSQAQLLDILLNHLQNDPVNRNWSYNLTEFKTNEHLFNAEEYRRALAQFKEDDLIEIYNVAMQTRYCLSHKGINFRGYVHKEYIEIELKRKEDELRQSVVDTNKSVAKTNKWMLRLTGFTAIILLVQVLVAILEYRKEQEPILKIKEIRYQSELQLRTDSSKNFPPPQNSSTDKPDTTKK